jgi:hypothetical protein
MFATFTLRNTFLFLACTSLVFSSGNAFADLTVNAVEFGLAKFHRYDNVQHPYSANSVWKTSVLPDGATVDQTPIQIKNSEHNYSIFFSSTDELIESVNELAQQTGEKIRLLNIHAHGAPGALFVPPTRMLRDSVLCSGWRKQASGSDLKNYRQYYSTVSGIELATIHASSLITDSMLTRILAPTFRPLCLSNIHTFEKQIKRIPDFKTHFSDDLKVHFLSCSVGLGRAGQQYTREIARMLLNSPAGRVEASLDLSLGDWSLPEGMSFWGRQSHQQLVEDNRKYSVNHSDREIMQPGRIRVGQIDESGNPVTTVITDQQFMSLD